MYWYISRQKIEALESQLAVGGKSWIKEVSLKLKVSFFEAGVTHAPDNQANDRVARIERELAGSDGLDTFPQTEGKGLFHFSLQAHRAVEQGAYLVVARAGETALLLAGSPTNAIGAPPPESGFISPTTDPVGAISRVSQGLGHELGGSLEADCSYVWASIARPVSAVWESLPVAEGIAVYGARLDASKSQMARSGFPGIRSIVVGSPLFLRQVVGR